MSERPALVRPVTERAPDAAAQVVLDVRAISKTYTATPVLVDANLRACRGEILGLLGANGAGKSTLLKIIAGIVPPSSGELGIGGVDVDFGHWGPQAAQRAGIVSVNQELSVFSNISVAENFAMAQHELAARSRRALRAAARAALDDVFPGNGIQPRAETGQLSMAERQMVEIAVSASRQELSILIMDEPTSALPAERAEQLHSYLRRRKDEGVLVIYVTHKLDEVLDIADRLVVLRDGNIHWEGDPRAVTHAELLVNLGARDLATEPPAIELVDEPAADQAGLGARDLLITRGDHPSGSNGIPLRVGPGELVGIAGLEGAGQRQLLREVYLTSDRRRSAFEVTGGAAYVSGDRKREGLFTQWSVGQNLILSSVARLSSFGWVRQRAADRTIREWYDLLQVRADGVDAPITSLSGGNQQKIIIARGFASGAGLVLLDDPTRGVDIETKTEFYGLLGGLRAAGRSAILYSTEDREFAHCDRVYVMAGGAIVRELRGPEVTRENIIHWSYQGAPASDEPAGPGPTRETPPVATRPARAVLNGLRTSRLSLVTVLLVAILITMRIRQPSSMSTNGLTLLLGTAMPLVLAALGQMFFIAAGDFDVGIGYAIGLTNVISATWLADNPAVGGLILLAMVAAYGLMAVITELTGVPAIVITLGASFIWLGCGLVRQPVPGGTVPAWLARAFDNHLAVIPLQVYLCVVLAAVAWFVLRRWRYGIALRSFGNSRQTFAETGRSTLRARVSLYLMAGVCVVFAGLMTTVSATASDINASSTVTLISVAAVVIGGAEFTGGVVEPVGAVLAAVAFGFVPSLLFFVGISPDYQTAVEGGLLILAMAIRLLVKGGSRWQA